MPVLKNDRFITKAVVFFLEFIVILLLWVGVGVINDESVNFCKDLRTFFLISDSMYGGRHFTFCFTLY